MHEIMESDGYASAEAFVAAALDALKWDVRDLESGNPVDPEAARDLREGRTREATDDYLRELRAKAETIIRR